MRHDVDSLAVACRPRTSPGTISVAVELAVGLGEDRGSSVGDVGEDGQV
jgi:hypothetical protein